MTNKEKELLTKDLCSRLDNHSLLVKYGEEDYNIIGISFGRVILVKPFMSMTSASPLIEEVKPYLRPMSSMTEEEKSEYCELQDRFLCSSQYPVTDAFEMFDWLNSHHFDYRGLIEKGLALEAPEDMYNNN